MTINDIKEMMSLISDVDFNESPVLTSIVNLNQSPQEAVEDLDRQASLVGRTLVDMQKWSFDEALQQMKNDLLENTISNAKSAIMYARVGEEPFFYVFPVGVEMETQLLVDELPQIYPIVETLDNYHRFVIVTLTAREAHIFETTAGAITSELLTERPELREKLGREWTRERYRDNKQDKKQKLIQSKVQVLDELMTKKGHNSLIVAGSPKMVSAFTKALPNRLKEMLIDTMDMNPRAGMDPILLECIQAFVQQEQEESHDRVADLESALMKQGLGIAGEDATVQAIEHGYANILIIDQDYPEQMRENLVRLALKYDIEIETVKESSKLKKLDGVGCLLRYRPAYIDLPKMADAS